jgi:hypothetical protein
MLRLPSPSAARSPSLQKPLPTPPCSAFPELPAELPGSLLLENQGFPSGTTPVSARPITQIFRQEIQSPYQHFKIETDRLDLLNLVPDQLLHARSVPDLRSRLTKMRSVRSSNALDSSTVAQSGPLKIQHEESLSETTLRRRSKQSLLTSPLSTDISSAMASRTRGHSNDLNRARANARRVSRQASRIREERPRNQDPEKRRSYRNEVSVISFFIDIYLLDN